MKSFKCIEALQLPKCDGYGFETGKYMPVKVGSVWHIPEDENYRLVGGEVRLESDKFGWIEISKDTLEEAFDPILLL